MARAGLVALGTALLVVVTLPLPALAQGTKESPGDLQIEHQQKQIIVQPKPDAGTSAKDAEGAARDIERARRTDDIMKGISRPPLRPDLDESVVGGIQSGNIQRVPKE